MESIKNRRPFCVGDRVKIARKIPDGHEGWWNGWVDAMDCLIGDERTIECVFPERKECKLLGTLWGWPLAALELVEATKEVPRIAMYEDLGKAQWATKTVQEIYDSLPAERPTQQAKAPPAGPVLPSDEAGIEAMIKRMLGQPKSAPPAAPAPQKPPFHKGLLIQASEKYMGLGFNDKQ